MMATEKWERLEIAIKEQVEVEVEADITRQREQTVASQTQTLMNEINLFKSRSREARQDLDHVSSEREKVLGVLGDAMKDLMNVEGEGMAMHQQIEMYKEEIARVREVTASIAKTISKRVEEGRLLQQDKERCLADLRAKVAAGEEEMRRLLKKETENKLSLAEKEFESEVVDSKINELRCSTYAEKKLQELEAQLQSKVHLYLHFEKQAIERSIRTMAFQIKIDFLEGTVLSPELMRSKERESPGQAASKPTIDGVLGQIYKRLEKLDGLFKDEAGQSTDRQSRRSEAEARESGLNSQIAQLQDSLKLELDNLSRSVEFAVERTRDACTEEVLARVEKNVLGKVEKAIQDKLDSLTAKILDAGFKKYSQAEPLVRAKNDKVSKRYFASSCSQEDPLPAQAGLRGATLSPLKKSASPKRKRSPSRLRAAAEPSNIKIQEETFVIDRASEEKKKGRLKHPSFPPVSSLLYFKTCDTALEMVSSLVKAVSKLIDKKRPAKQAELVWRRFVKVRQEKMAEFQVIYKNHKNGKLSDSSPERLFGFMLDERADSEVLKRNLQEALLTN